MNVIRSVRELEAIREQWDGVAAGFASPLLDHDWFLSCAESFHAEDNLRLVVVRQGGELSGVAPLAREGNGTGRRLALLGASKLFEPSGWIFSSSDALAELAASTVRLGEPVVLDRVPAESQLPRALGQLAPYRAVTVTRHTAPSLGISTSGRWDDYYGRLSSRITQNLPRVRARAKKKFGQIEIQHLDPTPTELNALLDTVAVVEGSGWKGRKGSALRQRPDLLGFFRRYCARAAERNRLRVSLLSFGGHVAAAELSVEAYGRAWQLKIGYREDLSSYYPGLQLTEASIRRAFDRGLDSYEFLGSAAEWERRWNTEERRYQSIVVYPLSLHGAIGACHDVADAMWRRTSRRNVKTTA